MCHGINFMILQESVIQYETRIHAIHETQVHAACSFGKAFSLLGLENRYKEID